MTWVSRHTQLLHAFVTNTAFHSEQNNPNLVSFAALSMMVVRALELQEPISPG